MKQIIMKTKLSKIGNSIAVILSKKILDKSNIIDGQEIEVFINDESALVLKPIKIEKKMRPHLNLNLSTWEAQFKLAIKNGQLPEKDVFENMSNTFDYSLK
ncbi:MAG: hypothetical protein CFE25_04020 [Chitinophagaceae bacterium BSSC1]|nr:MAG: hypothetical protein CFE25_04020 [Chitinophagaceae bacterium BSSC1]